MSQLMLLNPRKKSRKRRTPAQKAATRKLVASNRRRGRARPARRNPVARTYRRRRAARGGMAGLPAIMQTIVPAAIGGAGALALDVAFGMLPIPAALKTGPFAPVVKIGGAIGIGWLAGMVTTKKNANLIMAGGVTVALYSVFKGFLQRTMPQIQLGENDNLEYVGAGLFQPDPLIGVPYAPDFEGRASAGLSEYVDDYSMGEYVT